MTPTPGQVAHAAFIATIEAVPAWVPPFEALSPVYQRAWEAAAQAVLALQEKEKPAMPALYALALEATPALEAAFGAVLNWTELRMLRDEGGDALLLVVARVDSHDTAYLDGLLRLFDETWWLANCHRAGGQLVFDYETLEDIPHA
jgi:hypothetical protein